MRKMLLLCLMVLFLVPTASAVTTLTQTTFSPYQVVIHPLSYVNLTLSGANPNYGYTIYGTVGCPISNGWTATEHSYVGEFFKQNVTGNGTVHFTLNVKNYPYTGTSYAVMFYARPYWKTNGTYLNVNISSTLVYFSLQGSGTPDTNRISFRDHEPPTLAPNGGDAVNVGVSLNGTCAYYNSSSGSFDEITRTVWVFICNNEYPRHLLGYTKFNISTATSETDTLFGITYNYGTEYSSKDFGSSIFLYNMTYRIYYGLLLGYQNLGEYTGFPPHFTTTLTNTIIDNPDHTVSLVSGSGFSVSGSWNIWTGVPLISDTLTEDLTLNHKFTGAGVYLETPMYSTAYLSSHPFTIGTIGQWLRDYGASFGMPWLYLIIAFMIIAIFACIPFSFALRFDFDMPNFVYGVFISIGVFMSYGMSLLDLWMLIFYIVLIFLTITLKFQTQIRSMIGEFPKLPRAKGLLKKLTPKPKQEIGVLTPEERERAKQEMIRRVTKKFDDAYAQKKAEHIEKQKKKLIEELKVYQEV